MRLLSFDVGIKNMAYCLFDIEGVAVSVLDWNVVNLMDKEPETKLCTEIMTNKSKKNKVVKVCGKKAKWTKESLSLCLCEKHAKTSSFLIPNKQYSPANLKKLRIDELRQLAVSRLLPITDQMRKPELLSLVTDFFSGVSLEPIKVSKVVASELDLITIGRNLKREFDQIELFQTVTHIIVENQISPIATRMKTIQGMLTQYFIMRHDDSIVIEFLSSAGKLKGFEKQNETVESEYAQHKKDAVFYCSRFLESERFCAWSHVLETRKKDDLADCFLQGIHWMKRHNINLNA